MIDKIQEEAIKVFTVSNNELLGKSRRRKVVVARHLSMLAARDIYKISLKKIAKPFNRDHSTVIHALETISYQMSTDLILCNQYLTLIERLPNVEKEYLERYQKKVSDMKICVNHLIKNKEISDSVKRLESIYAAL